MDLNASQLTRRIQFRRNFAETYNDDGNLAEDWQDHGDLVHARRRDISDQEKVMAGTLNSVLVTRFVVRSSAFTRDICDCDRLVHEGRTFEITGIKEVPPGRAFLEITAESDGTL